MVKQKIIKVKVGDVFINGKQEGVYKTYWRKESKNGKVYYESVDVAFPSEVEVKDKQPKITSEKVVDV